MRKGKLKNCQTCNEPIQTQRVLLCSQCKVKVKIEHQNLIKESSRFYQLEKALLNKYK